MALGQPRTIQVISHGPSCLDGVMAAATVARFYDSQRVLVRLASNNESDRVIRQVALKAGGEGDEIWITDLSWTSVETAIHLTELARAGARLYWVDHHRTALLRRNAAEFKVPFAARVLSDKYSAARLVFNFLRRRLPLTVSAQKRRAFDSFYPFVALADDHDRWLHRIAESSDWALAVETLGGMDSYREIVRLDKPQMTRRLRQALAVGRLALNRSLELSRTTAFDRLLSSGVKLRSACCFGYPSEVAAHLYEGQTNTVVALLDLQGRGVSLRRSPDCQVDLSRLAENLGGGGHAAAAGFPAPRLSSIAAQRLAEMLSSALQLETQKA